MMKIKFHKKYYKKILAGDKTQTLRLANKRLDVDIGDIVLAVFPGLEDKLTLKITRKSFKQFKNVNDEDVKLEGYDNLADLKNDLIYFYPTIEDGDRLYYYRFEVVDGD